MKNWLVVVPARIGSKRLQGKPLQKIHGKALVVRACESLKPLQNLGARLVVATDSEEVLSVIGSAGFYGVLTNHTHPCGTDRCFEVSQNYPDYSYVMNVQGDEIFDTCADLESLAHNMEQNAEAGMGTLYIPSTDEKSFLDPNTVKLVKNNLNYALYFSRASIPFERDKDSQESKKFWFNHHIGVYAFRREALEKYARFPQSYLEQHEKLEQLRALENGISILCVEAKH